MYHQSPQFVIYSSPVFMHIIMT